MPEPGETGSTEESFHCHRCGNMFATEGREEGECPVCGFHCTRQTCEVMDVSDVGF
jgi:rRNA maturation endonuclease Nob1